LHSARAVRCLRNTLNRHLGQTHNAGAEIERQQIENGWLLDPLWNIIQQVDHFGQLEEEIVPAINGFNNEFIVDAATLTAMEASLLAVVIWSEDVVEEII